MPLPRSIIYSRPLGGTRGRLDVRERYRERCCEIAVATTGCRCRGRLRRRRGHPRARARDGTVRFINRCVFASVDDHDEADRAKRRECHEFPEPFALFSKWRLAKQ